MARLGGADKVIIGEIHPACQITEILADTVGKILWCNAFVMRRLFDLLTVFIGAGQEHHIIAIQTLETRKHITGQRCVGVTDMRLVIDVIDRCRDIERCLGLACHSAVHEMRKRREPVIVPMCRMYR